ncbi:hypothetical protein ACMZ6Z_07855 [Streptococcus pluranimalium]|uniref:hypothetical protein n=1 Tax=Streptococcus pluranimalium TaxID=82348 RepID=UPI0039FC99C6
MDIKINQIASGFHLMSIDGRKFVMDNRTLSSKLYFWGRRRHQITVDIVEIDSNDTRFDVKNSPIGSSAVVLMVQPAVNVIYKNLKSLFVNQESVKLFLLKIMMFIVSLFVSYGIYLLIFNFGKRKITNLLAEASPRYRVTFTTDGKKNYGLGIIFLPLLLISALAYFTYFETALILVGLFAFATYAFSFTLLPISISYHFSNLVFDKIKEIEDL